jgi:uncharacterized protein
MNTSLNSLLPVEQNDRIYSLDILRGIVLLGILLMNINLFGLAKGDPSVAGGIQGWNLYSWMTTNVFFEGTADQRSRLITYPARHTARVS